MKPKVSEHFLTRQPSAIRLAQIEFNKRIDHVKAVNTAIGNVSLPIHPALHERMFNLNSELSPFRDGTVKYTPSVGSAETNEAFLNIIASSGFRTDHLHSQVTDGGSAAMELMILGVCGQAGENNNPLMMIDAAYTNYLSMASRTGRQTVSLTRKLQDNGKFTLPATNEIRKLIETARPNALLVIPYDNPTGHFYSHRDLVVLAELCVEFNLWMVSDEAYRELYYTEEAASSIWGLTEEEVPGISGRRISIETASKVWNGCGLRIGALVTDNQLFHEKSVAEFTANLCAPAIDQYIFGALAHISHDELNKWYEKQRSYYRELMVNLTEKVKLLMPQVIISSPDASIYSVVDVRHIVKPNFNAKDFVLYCAQQGKVDITGTPMTLLVAPMSGFYSTDRDNPGDTQMRIAYVAPPVQMKLVPELLCKLLTEYEKQRNTGTV